MGKKICGVYKITNIINGKFYIGSSKDIKYRWRQHKKKLDEGIHGNPHLQGAWNKYGGEKSFRFEIIEECSPDIQFEREQFYLNTLKPFDENGYNIVRRISKQYMSDNYMVKECEKCGQKYNTFSNLSKYCDECKEELKIGYLEGGNSTGRLSAKAEEEGFAAYMNSCVPGYGSNYYWDTEI